MEVGLYGECNFLQKVMNLQLGGKTVLVTGSSRGIGKSIAKAFYDEGCNLILNGRDHNTILQTLQEFPERTSYFVGDVTNSQTCNSLIKKVIEDWGKLDILICNVGSGKSVPSGCETSEEWNRVLGINFFSTTNMVEAAKHELKKTQGTIVCISSIAGVENTAAPLTYSVAKAALNTYVKGISKVLAKDNIRINAVAPGNILFEHSVWDNKLKENPTFVEELLQKEVALNRLGTPEEIANFVIFLSSKLSDFATGSIFVVDGGQTRSIS